MKDDPLVRYTQVRHQSEPSGGLVSLMVGKIKGVMDDGSFLANTYRLSVPSGMDPSGHPSPIIASFLFRGFTYQSELIYQPRAELVISNNKDLFAFLDFLRVHIPESFFREFPKEAWDCSQFGNPNLSDIEDSFGNALKDLKSRIANNNSIVVPEFLIEELESFRKILHPQGHAYLTAFYPRLF